MTRTPILILPGYGDSGPAHWQSLWQAAEPAMQRVPLDDWEQPHCARWLARLETAVAECGPDTLLVAHSLACLLVAHWAAQRERRIRGALLVAVPDPLGPNFPGAAQGFAPLPLKRFDFPSLVVASSDDPFSSSGFAQACASAWGSRCLNIGAAGHINDASGLGEWREGRELLRSLA
ncbi:MAG TPA: alpha/beta fold hydrolase [Pseudomonas sp.]|nr:alpha/beta fold hydrolase [Pseudomonas sp.]